MNSSSSSDPRREFIFLATPTLQQWIVSALTLVAFLLLKHPALLSSITEGYFGGIEGDGGIYVWLARHTALEFFAHPWFDTGAFYPYSGTLAFSDNFLLFGGVFALLRLLFSSEALAYNLTYALLLIVGGLCTFRLMFALTAHAVTSVGAGIFAISLAPLAAHLGHPQLQAFFSLPLITLLVLNYLKTRAWQDGVKVGLCLVATFLIGVYMAVFAALLALFLCASLLLLHPRGWRLSDWGLLALTGGVGLIPLAPFAAPYLAVRNLFGGRELYEAAAFAASPLSFIAHSPWSFLYGATSGLSHAEAHLGAGFVLPALTFASIFLVFAGDRLRGVRLALCALPLLSVAIEVLFPKGPLFYGALTALSWTALACAVWSLVELRQAQRLYDCQIVTNRDLKASLLFAAVLFGLLALGPIAPLTNAQSSWAPHRLFYMIVPGVEAIRATGRFGIVAVFLFGLVSLITLSELARRKRIHSSFFVGALVALIVENYTSQYPFDYALSRPLVLDSVTALAANRGGHSSMLILPYAPAVDAAGDVQSWRSFARANVYAMNWALGTGVPIVNGFSGQKTRFMRDLPRRLRGFPDAGSLREIASVYALRYIVVVPTLFESFSPIEFEATLENTPELKLRARDAANNYLLEFVGEQRLDPDFALKVPGTASSVFLDFKVAPGCTDESVDIALSEYGALSPFARFVVNADGEWKRKEINLLSLEKTLGMRRIRFTTKSACVLAMRR